MNSTVNIFKISRLALVFSVIALQNVSAMEPDELQTKCEEAKRLGVPKTDVDYLQRYAKSDPTKMAELDSKINLYKTLKEAKEVGVSERHINASSFLKPQDRINNLELHINAQKKIKEAKEAGVEERYITASQCMAPQTRIDLLDNAIKKQKSGSGFGEGYGSGMGGTGYGF